MKLFAYVLALAAASAAVLTVPGTLHGAPPALGGAIGAALLALLAIVLLRRRPAAAAAVAALGIAAAFAASALVLGGSDVSGGIAFLFLAPADSAALVISAAVVLAAAGAVVVVRGIVLRSAIVLLASYALVPTLASIGKGGLTGALASAPFAWTRGTYVGCEALLPLASLGACVWALVHVARKRVATAGTALALALAFLCAANLGAYAAATLGQPSLAAFERTGVPAAGAAAVADSADATPVTTISPPPFAIAPAVATAARTLGDDPQAALSFVARVRDEFYDGVVRGAAGTLASGGGDAADKALLLHDLILARHPDAALRFATCDLSDAQSGAFAATALGESPVGERIGFSSVGTIANATRDPESKKIAARLARLWQSFVALNASESQSLESESKQTGIALPAPLPGDGRALLAHHVWLQMQSASAGWTDLDPTLAAAAKPGATRCAASATSADLDPARYAVLQLRVVVEERVAGAARTRTLLAASMRVADAAARPLAIVFAEPAGLDARLGALASPPPSLRRFTPLLQIGDRFVPGTSFLLPLPTPARSTGQTSAGAAGLAASAFGTAATPAPSPAPAAAADVTAAWIDLTLQAPGAGPETYRSTIFDRVGLAARNAPAAPSPALADVGTAYLPLATAWTLGVTSGGFTAGAGDGSAPAGASDLERAIDGVASLHGAFATLRHALFSASEASRGYVVVEPRPALSLLAISLQAIDGGLAKQPHLWMDAATDHAQFVTRPGAPAPAPPVAPAATWAVSSLLAERFVANASRLLTDSTTDPAQAGRVGDDVINVFALAREQNNAPTSIADGTQLAALDATPDTKARLGLALASGQRAIAPAHEASVSPDYGWWLVDPSTGLVRDETRSGRHQDELPGEALVDEDIAVESAPAAKRMGIIAKCVPWIAGVVLALGGDLNGAADIASTYAQDLEKIEEMEQKMKDADSAEACVSG